MVSCVCVKQEVLKQLQGTIEEESGEASGSQLDLIERLKGEQSDVTLPEGVVVLTAHSLCSFCPAGISLDSSGFKPRTRPPPPPVSSSSSASSSSGAPAGAAGASGAPGPSSAAAFPRKGLPSAGRDSHDRCLEELENERYHYLFRLPWQPDPAPSGGVQILLQLWY